MRTFGAQASSFRDPSGFVYLRGDVLLRQVNKPYERQFRWLLESGLHDELVSRGLLIHAERIGTDYAQLPDAIEVLQPEVVPFISYPYEWCFSQLKDAALLTLEIASLALEKDMILKDASAYNVQFLRGKPIFIDTLSFDVYEEGKPWIAYRQFCQHFLAPLALMSTLDVRIGQLLRVFLDGIPVDLASRMLPHSSWLKPGLVTHIRLHGKAVAHPPSDNPRTARMSRFALKALLHSLRSTISSLRLPHRPSTWSEYYSQTNYSKRAMQHKRELVSRYLACITPLPKTCWDLGANIGEFSKIAAETGLETVAWDLDPFAVDIAYERFKAAGEQRILPLVQDLTNPSPDIGWGLAERDGLLRRAPVDVVLCLALVHHLAIGNNVPLPRVASFLADLGEWLVIEFIAKEDSQIQRMLQSREDVFHDYDAASFEAAFAREYEIIQRDAIQNSHRTLYLMRRRMA